MSAEPSIDPRALGDPEQMGEGTRLLAFAFVAEDSVIGRDCTIGEHSLMESGVTVGDRVTLQPGAKLRGGTRVGDGALIGENAVVRGGGAEIGPEAVIGPNATVLAGVSIGHGAVVESGSVAVHSVPPNAIVQGNPARITSYVGGESTVAESVETRSATAAAVEPRVPGVRILPVTRAKDLRGSLMAIEFSELPFSPARVFTVFDVLSEEIRGSHAHRETEQILVSVAGSLSCVVDDGGVREEIRLEDPNFGLYIPPMIWATQYKYSSDGVLMVLASHPYDAAEYIRDYDEFLRLQAGR